ncbi:hypothetical protein COC54_27235 [Bacillus pseudomycoides]|nr:hypothetical protein CN564_02315 [Bacillus pseudomycoides]PGR94522.1 hypothetical protein COC54_27235 [Bacillus pseudomycoides]PHC83524.1 hypothetical protein COF36_25205 [Bacillus pseudomycoides]
MLGQSYSYKDSKKHKIRHLLKNIKDYFNNHQKTVQFLYKYILRGDYIEKFLWLIIGCCGGMNNGIRCRWLEFTCGFSSQRKISVANSIKKFWKANNSKF